MGASDLLRHLHKAGFTVVRADGGGIRVAPSASLTDVHRNAIRDHRAELLVLLAPPANTDPDRWCWPHSDAMNGSELEQFTKRAQQFTRRGISPDDSEAMADRLVIRDREQDDRRICLECTTYRPGRCGNHRRAGLHAPEVGRDLAEMLQRCPGFASSFTTKGTAGSDRSPEHEGSKPAGIETGGVDAQ